jgi:hypothetical protein
MWGRVLQGVLSHQSEHSCRPQRASDREAVAGDPQNQTDFAMGKKGSTSLTSAAAVQKLAEELKTQTSPEIILQGLKLLARGLYDERTGYNIALWFLRAGGLPTLIRHLRASPMAAPTAGSDITPSALSKEAATALGELLRTERAIMAEFKAATHVIMPLIDALRDAPLNHSRGMAFNLLGVLAIGKPGHRLAMGEAGVVGLLVTLYIESAELLEEMCSFASMAARMTHMLLEAGMAAALDLAQAILARETVRTFTAIVLLIVRHPCLYPFGPSLTNHRACKTSSCRGSPVCILVVGAMVEVFASHGAALIDTGWLD